MLPKPDFYSLRDQKARLTSSVPVSRTYSDAHPYGTQSLSHSSSIQRLYPFPEHHLGSDEKGRI